jgi:hypothetical protein
VRIANVNHRLKLLVADGAVDVETASSGRFGPSTISDPRRGQAASAVMLGAYLLLDQRERSPCPSGRTYMGDIA